jgi:dolichyl-phosphate-mannose-protein mannosyltransferase
MPDPPRRSVWAALALVTAGALALRLPYLGNQSLWYDESFTRTIAAAPSITRLWHEIKATEGTPPLYYLLTWGWAKLFGIHSDAALRATSGLAGAACAPAAFVALRRFAGGRAALAAAALVATSPMLVWYSLDARAYSLLVLLSLISIWATSLVLERPTGRRFAGWTLAAAATVWTHYFGAFLVVAEAALLLWRLPEARRRTLGWSAAAAALAAPLVPVLSAQTDARTDFIGSLALGDRLEQAGRQLAMGPNVPRAWLEGVGVALAAAGVAGGLVAARRSRRLRPTALLAAIAIAIPLFLSVTDIEDRLLARNALIVWPCLAALAAVGLLRLRGLPLALYVAAGVATIVWIESDWRYQNPDWRGAARTVPRAAATVPAAAFPALDAPVAAVYLDRHQVPGPVATDRILVAVEPARIGRRELAPVSTGPRVPSGFTSVWSRTYHGFRLFELRARMPRAVGRAELGRDVLGDPPALLIVRRR